VKLILEAITEIEDKPAYEKLMAVIRFRLPDPETGEIHECGAVSLPNDVWLLLRASIIDGVGLFQDNEIEIEINETTYDQLETFVGLLEESFVEEIKND
jgi:hypothetical protein